MKGIILHTMLIVKVLTKQKVIIFSYENSSYVLFSVCLFFFHTLNPNMHSVKYRKGKYQPSSILFRALEISLNSLLGEVLDLLCSHVIIKYNSFILQTIKCTTFDTLIFV
jgi:hypothetical protein